MDWKMYLKKGGNPHHVEHSDWPSYSGYEKQTSITQEGDDRGTWRVATTDPSFINKLLKKDHKPLDKSKFDGVFYFVLTGNELSIRKPVSETERERRRKLFEELDPFDRNA